MCSYTQHQQKKKTKNKEMKKKYKNGKWTHKTNEKSHNLRLNQSWSITFSASWCILYGCQFSVNIAIQFVIQIEITLILQRCAACCTFETIDMKIFIFDANKNTTKKNDTGTYSYRLITLHQFPKTPRRVRARAHRDYMHTHTTHAHMARLFCLSQMTRRWSVCVCVCVSAHVRARANCDSSTV